jgi:phage tail P2-like protein
MLPWLAWGVSIDFWSSDWTEEAKRAAIAGAIEAQRRKGTPASLRAVLDRFDPMIAVVEWFNDTDNLDPHEFRLELPLAADSAVNYDEGTVQALLRDIAAVKPLRSHMLAVHRLYAQAHAGLISAARVATFSRIDAEADSTAAADPVWNTYLLTENGEPLQLEDGTFLEIE